MSVDYQLKGALSHEHDHGAAIGTAFRISLGVVMLIAGGLKITDLGQSAVAVKAYRLFPQPIQAEIVGYALPPLEMLVGALLLVFIHPSHRIGDRSASSRLHHWHCVSVGQRFKYRMWLLQRRRGINEPDQPVRIRPGNLPRPDLAWVGGLAYRVATDTFGTRFRGATAPAQGLRVYAR